ncbi:hypothetical protein GQ53DRAFT_847895 [Thozetella sp. PMI_491]|nr:hypothetical protein GQ53DRAFT_847895 [Thozetella sp. PMI_491]
MLFTPLLMAGIAAAAAITEKRGSAASSTDVQKASTLNVASAAAYCGGLTYAECSNDCYYLGYIYYACYSTYCLCYD